MQNNAMCIMCAGNELVELVQRVQASTAGCLSPNSHVKAVWRSTADHFCGAAAPAANSHNKVIIPMIHKYVTCVRSALCGAI